MIWIIISSILIASLSAWAGYFRFFYLYEVSLRRLLLAILTGVTVYSAMLFLFKIEILSEAVAGAIITNVYASVFGFFTGSAVEQYQIRKQAGDIQYIHRSFFSDQLPVIVAIGLISLGFYRTALFSGDPVTPIRLASGLSVISIGVWGMTLRLVPELRSKGIIILDKLVSWKNLVNYSWFQEDVLEIEYELDDSIRSFKTYIPPEDQLRIEKILSEKMLEKLEED